MNFKELVRIGKDAETRATANGKPLAAWPAAFDSGWGQNKKTEWLDCTYWGERGAKVAPHVKKGDLLLVEGEIGTREYEGKTRLTLNVSEIKFVGGRSGSSEGGRSQGENNRSQPDNDFSDDLPF